jgi:hypothetical protein
MTGGWGKKRAALMISVAALGMINQTAGAQVAPVSNTTGSASAQAQQNQPAQGSSLSIQGNFRSSLKVDDNGALRVNPAGTDTRLTNTLGINVVSLTPTQNLTLSFGADLQFENKATGREQNGIEKPFVRLNYTLDGVDNQLRVNGFRRTDDINDSVFIDTDGDLIGDTLLTSDGTVTNTSVGAGYSFGLQSPFGMDFNYRHDERTFDNVVSPNRYDRTTDDFGVTARFRINPATTARLIFNETLYDAQNVLQTERTTTDIGAGLAYEATPDLRFDLQVTQTNIEEDTTGGTVKTDGLSAAVGMTRDLNNGNFSVNASRVQSTFTARNQIVASRSLALPAGSFSFGAGVSTSNTGNTAFIGSLSYANQLPSGVLSANITRTATVNVDDEEVARTNVGISYLHDLNPISAVNFGLNVADVSDIGTGSVAPATRADFKVEYRHQLNQDWDWTLGYTRRYLHDSGGNTANSNVITTSIGRSFQIRP